MRRCRLTRTTEPSLPLCLPRRRARWVVQMNERRARVQGEATNCRRGHKPYGTVAWAEHVEAWEAYHRMHWQQDAETIHGRGGFSYWEMTDLLGREPATWEPSG